MQTWQSHMPKDMFLKSEGLDSSLYDPESSYTLAKHAEEQGVAYARTGLPVGLKTFCDYGVASEERQVPDLERNDVVAVQACQHGFDLSLDNDDRLMAGKVVFAVASCRAYRPPELAELPDELVTRNSEQHELSQFTERGVIVLGAGASAIDFGNFSISPEHMYVVGAMAAAHCGAGERYDRSHAWTRCRHRRPRSPMLRVLVR